MHLLAHSECHSTAYARPFSGPSQPPATPASHHCFYKEVYLYFPRIWPIHRHAHKASTFLRPHNDDITTLTYTSEVSLKTAFWLAPPNISPDLTGKSLLAAIMTNSFPIRTSCWDNSSTDSTQLETSRISLPKQSYKKLAKHMYVLRNRSGQKGFKKLKNQFLPETSADCCQISGGHCLLLDELDPPVCLGSVHVSAIAIIIYQRLPKVLVSAGRLKLPSSCLIWTLISELACHIRIPGKFPEDRSFLFSKQVQSLCAALEIECKYLCCCMVQHVVPR